MDTKACNLTEEEIKVLMNHHGYCGSVEDRMERLNYLHKRLKAFGDKDETENKQPASAHINNEPGGVTWPSN